MSTKTLRKRIALVAVSALGAGLLSIAPANAAGTATFGATTGSTGLVGDIAGSALSKTATVLSTGKIIVAIDAAQMLKVSAGAAIVSADHTAATGNDDVAKINGSQSCVDKTPTFVGIVPTGAAGSTFTITLYNATSAGTCAAGGGTLVDLATVTIASSSNAGTASSTNSSVSWVDYGVDSSSDAKYMATADATGKSSTTRGLALYAHVQLRDVYNAAITSTTGSLTATVSSGAVVSIGGGDDATAFDPGTYTTAANSATLNTSMSNSLTGASNNATKGHAWVRVQETTAGTGWAGTLTISYNGVVVATKTGTISGDVAKITATPLLIGSLSGTTAAAFEYQVYDAAGNVVVIDQSKLLKSSSSNSASVADAYGDAANTTTATGTGTVSCGATAGKSDVVLYFVNAGGTIVKSSSVSLACGDRADTYTASFDKTSYKQGDVATLTIKFLDVKGNAANSVTAVSATPSADQVLTAPQMKLVTEAGGYKAAKKVGADGTVKYVFTVGTDSGIVEGNYNAVVSFPTINAYNGVNQAVSYAVTSGAGATVTNAQVLASIVKLIASINKQIVALQKLLLKKK